MPGVHDCPRTDVLERFLLGHFAQPEADSIETHVQYCARCSRTMETVNAVDPLVVAMREAKATLNAPYEAAEAITPWLKRLRPKDAGQTVSMSPRITELSAPTVGPVAASYNFLRDPELPDELGRLAQYRVLQSIGVGGCRIVAPIQIHAVEYPRGGFKTSQ